MESFGLYVIITNPILTYSSIAKICVENEIKMLQLREKTISDRDLLKAATEIASITKGTKTKFVVNDRPDIAKLCNADYIHLGQDDISMNNAKKISNPRILYGLSTHSLDQVKNAAKFPFNYIGFGPIYNTTKKNNLAPVGIKNLKNAIKISKIPVVAIGGISEKNIDEILKTGAKSIAMINYLMHFEKLDYRIKKIKEKIFFY